MNNDDYYDFDIMENPIMPTYLTTKSSVCNLLTDKDFKALTDEEYVELCSQLIAQDNEWA